MVSCYCDFSGTDFLPYWNINGSLFPPYNTPPPYFVNETGLFFTAIPELSNTYYQCIFGETVKSNTGTVSIALSPFGKCHDFVLQYIIIISNIPCPYSFRDN